MKTEACHRAVSGLINRGLAGALVPVADHAEGRVRAEGGAQGLTPSIILAPPESRFCFHAIVKSIKKKKKQLYFGNCHW